MKNNLFSSQKPKIGVLALLFIFCGLFSQTANAQKMLTWTAATNTNWADAGNWSQTSLTFNPTAQTDSGTAIVTVASTTELRVGDTVTGTGIPASTTVLTIDTATTFTMSANATANLTTATNLVFTGVARSVSAVPAATDTAILDNNSIAAPVITGTVTVARFNISNTVGTTAGPTFTIPTGTTFNCNSSVAAFITVAGGNIVNNGTLKIENTTITAAAAGINFTTPIQLPLSAIEYGYSGTGHLVMNTPAVNAANGCVFLVNAANTNSTIRLTFNGTTDFTLTAGAFVGVAIRASATASTVSPLIIDGAGFTFGTSMNPKNGGLIGTGNRANVTINPETTLNFFSATTNPTSAIGVFMQNAAIVADQANILNLGKINIRGTFTGRTAIQFVLDVTAASAATASTTVANFENRGLLNVDVSQVNASRGALWTGTFQTAAGSSIGTVNITNTATGVMNLINSQAFATNLGHAIRLEAGTYSPFVNINNAGTLNLTGTNVNTASSLAKSRITNNGTINSNNNFNLFTVLNNTAGTIAFVDPAGAGSNNFAFGSSALTNNGKIQTATGTTFNSNLRNIGSYSATSTIEPGGAGYGISDLGIINATTAGTVKLQIAGNTAGVDYDQLNITNSGAGYTSIPTVSFSNGAGTGAIGYVTLAAGVITSVTIVNGGSGYRNGAPVTFSVGSGQSGTTVVTGGVITGVTLSGVGTGYTTATNVTFANAPTTAATATATMSGGVVTGISLSSGGSGYTNVPTIAFSASGSTTSAAVTATISGGAVTGFNTVFSLSGLNLDIPFLYTPTVATTLPIVTLSGFGSITGTFASVTGLKAGWALDYSSPTVVNLVYTSGTTTATTWTGTNSSVWTDTGNWSASVPTVSSNVTIAAAANQPVIGTNVNINSLTINATASVTVNSGFNLSVTDAITNNGSLTIANNANLIQTNNVANSGSGTTNVNRNSNALSRLDYTIWSSPVTNASQFLTTFSPFTSRYVASPLSLSQFYTYNQANNQYSSILTASTTVFTAGSGYLIRIPNNHPTVATIWNGSFTGVPNNGTINTSLSYDGATFGFNMVGNPYPSTIDAGVFISTNTSIIESSLYFWRKINAAIGSAYAVYNPMGSTTASPSSAVPNGTIQVGQGFFVKAKSASTLTFTNAMRVGNNANQIFKTKAAQKDRLWVNLTTAAGVYSQALVGYTADATLAVDLFDAPYINDSPIALTSNINGEEYTIQGRPAFDATDVVALSFKTDVAGAYSIALDHFDGVFASGQDVYLVDSKTGTETNLKNGAYTFTSDPASDKTRFSLQYQKSLNVAEVAMNENSVSVYKNNESIYVSSKSVAIANIKVFDVQGRLLAEKNNLKANEAVIGNFRASRQVLIVKVQGIDNSVVTKKLMN